MKSEAAEWLEYARENVAIAEWCLQAGHLNPCLQNAQQTVEESLKALRCHCRLPDKRTHAISVLCRDLSASGIEVGLSQEDCELLDSIYVESKYPTPSVVPHSPPDPVVCRRCVKMAQTVLQTAERITAKS